METQTVQTDKHIINVKIDLNIIQTLINTHDVDEDVAINSLLAQIKSEIKKEYTNYKTKE
jgi:hypothetical protein